MCNLGGVAPEEGATTGIAGRALLRTREPADGALARASRWHPTLRLSVGAARLSEGLRRR